MIKKSFKKELVCKTIKDGGFTEEGENTGNDAERVQEWLQLYSFYNPDFICKIAIDNDFGPKTTEFVKQFQHIADIEMDGVIGPESWGVLIEPMREAYDSKAIKEEIVHANKNFSVRDAILVCAARHLQRVPRELNAKNEGPWVRAYMGGHDGQAWAWCVGSALQIIDQAFSMRDLKFTDYLPNTYSCDKLGSHALKNKRLIRNKELREMTFEELKRAVRPGDILNIVKSETDWTHTMIILEVHQSHFITWEGNTNDEGSREGFEVCIRKRVFRRSNVDVILLGID